MTDLIKNPFPKGKPTPKSDPRFTGSTFIAPLLQEDDLDIKISHLSFEAGSRNNWHIHHEGYQILLVTEGQGFYQEEGKPAQKLGPGDVVYIKEGIKHWHGASHDRAFSHLTITKGSYKWLEKVDDESYLALKED